MNEREWANEFNQKPIKKTTTAAAAKHGFKKCTQTRQFSKTQTKYAHKYIHTHTHTLIRPDCVSKTSSSTWARAHGRALKKRKIVEHEVNATTTVWRSLLPLLLLLLPPSILHECSQTFNGVLIQRLDRGIHNIQFVVVVVVIYSRIFWRCVCSLACYFIRSTCMLTFLSLALLFGVYLFVSYIFVILVIFVYLFFLTVKNCSHAHVSKAKCHKSHIYIIIQHYRVHTLNEMLLLLLAVVVAFSVVSFSPTRIWRALFCCCCCMLACLLACFQEKNMNTHASIRTALYHTLYPVYMYV